MRRFVIAIALLSLPVAAAADSGRETLTQTAFVTRDKTAALAQIAGVLAHANAALAKAPDDREAQMTRAMATSYRAKLTRSRGDALDAKAQFEAIAAQNPRDAEAQAALGAWHLNAVESLGTLLALGGLGAHKGIGLQATDRAVTLGGDRALFPALAGILRIAIDPKDARGAALLDLAGKDAVPTALDRQMQHRAIDLAAAVKAGDAKRAQALARRLLPLGQFP